MQRLAPHAPLLLKPLMANAAGFVRCSPAP